MDLSILSYASGGKEPTDDKVFLRSVKNEPSLPAPEFSNINFNKVEPKLPYQTAHLQTSKSSLALLST